MGTKPQRCAEVRPSLTVADINELRLLLKRTRNPPADKVAQRATRRITDAARREAYRAAVLAWAVADWHERVARLKISCPDLWAIGAGDCPTEYTARLGDRYKRRNQFNY